MNRHYLLIIISFLSLNAMAQEPASTLQPVKLGENVSVKFGGWARADYFLDSRKGKEAVDGLFYLWPEAVSKDGNGKDLNAKVNQNLSATATRFTALFTGPDALHAKSSAYFEFDFTGGSSNYLLFRQGWVKLDWAKTSLQIGRLWHPLHSPVPPSNVPLNYGAPYNIFCRGEQIRFTYKPGAFTLLGALFFQSGHASFGPNGQSLQYLRNSAIPDLNFQVHYTKGNFTTGIMTEYKWLQPKEYTTINNINYKTSVKVGSGAIAAFGQYKKGIFTLKGNAMYGQNMAEMSMQGGYAVKSVDAITGKEEYTVSSAFTSWLNLIVGDKVKYGLFAGFQKNLGFQDALTAGVYKFYGRTDNIDKMFRIAPSISYYTGRMVFQAEEEISSAAYGTVDMTDNGRVKDSEWVTNNRLYLSVSYLF
jgi:hypothetical protein